MIFDEFAPSTAQRLEALKVVRDWALMLISAGGATSLLIFAVVGV